MDYLTDSDTSVAKRLSSINQYRNFIGVMKDGMFCPLIFDQLDGIICGEVKSHPIMIYFGDWIGYNMPIQKAEVTSSTIMIADDEGESLQILPEQFGRGDCWHTSFYEEYHNREVAMVGDNGQMVGFQETTPLNIGLDYIDVNDELEAVD